MMKSMLIILIHGFLDLHLVDLDLFIRSNCKVCSTRIDNSKGVTYDTFHFKPI